MNTVPDLYAFDLVSLSVCLKKNRVGDPSIETEITPKYPDQADKLSYVFEVRSEGRTLKKDDRTVRNRDVFMIPETGVYTSRVWVYYDNRERYYLQKTIHYYDQAVVDEYAAFISGTDPDALVKSPPPYSLKCAPVKDFAVVSVPEARQDELEACVKRIHADLSVKVIFGGNGAAVSIISDEIRDGFVFSGKALTGKKMVIGESEFRQIPGKRELHTVTGNFSYAMWENDGVEVGSDYYGLYRLFRYTGNDFVCIANSYHLLLLLLKEMKECLDIDEKLSAIPLLSAGGLMLQQRLSHHMDVKGIDLLPIDCFARISEEGRLTVVQKKWREYLDQDRSCGRDYAGLFRKTRKELVGNVKKLLADKHYSSQILDITGGKDSRIILAALLRCRRKLLSSVYLHYNDSGSEEKYIVAHLKRLSGLQWDELPETREEINMWENDFFNRSFFLGLSYSRGAFELGREESSECYLGINGAGGDGLYRPYFGLLYSKMSFLDERDMADNLLMFLENNALFPTGRIRETFIDAFSGVLQEIGGTSLKEKLNNHYIYFRNSTHFGGQFLINSQLMCSDYWHPLMTPSIIKLLHCAVQSEYSLRLQIDITAKLSRKLMTIPYEDKKDRKAYVQRCRELGISAASETVEPIDISDYEHSKEAKKKNGILVRKDADWEKTSMENQKYRESYFDRFETALRKLLVYKKGVFADVLGIDLFFFYREGRKRFLTSGKIRNEDIYVMNKIFSVVDQIEICAGEEEWTALAETGLQ